MLCECEGQSQVRKTVSSNMKENTQAELKLGSLWGVTPPD